MEMPTRNGISVPLHELELPETRLDINRPENLNNHHNEWQRRDMGRFAITQTLRDLTRHQFLLPKDVHQDLHRLYEPPKFPTLQQALDEVEEAYQSQETLQVYLIDQKRYEQFPISDNLMQKLHKEYNRYGGV